jgi:hypothetical protein
MNQFILILILIVGLYGYIGLTLYIVNKIVFMEIDNDERQEKINKDK